MEGLPGGSIDGGWAVPPMAPKTFAPGERREDRERRAPYDLPSSYVLADGIGPKEIPLLLAGWTWVDSAVGASTSLVVLSRGRGTGSRIRSRAASLRLESSVRVVERILPDDLPAIYRGAEAFLVVGEDGVGEGLCSALACGLAIVAIESAQASSLLGPAGYLVPAGDARRLGAACLTVLVEPAVSERLRGEAAARGERLLSDEPLGVLLSHLERLAG
jgi:glycosyltransferase involved in cell wall biosynthesis